MTSPRQRAAGERHVPPAEAIRQLTVWSGQYGLDWKVTTLWEGWAGGRRADNPTITRVELLSGGVRVGEGTGKGLGQQAVASGMYEAFEHLVSLSTPEGLPSPRSVGTFPAGRGPSPGRLDVPRSALSEVLAERDALGRLLRGPQGPDTIAAVPMRPAADVITGGNGPAALLPAALVDLSYVPPAGENHAAERLASSYCSSNGIAAGLSPADTILHALQEVIERDAVSALLTSVMTGESHGHSITLAGMEDLGWLADCIRDDFGTDIEVRRLRSLSGHVVAAISTTADSRGCAVLGCGASGNLAYAVERALLELAQDLVAEVDGEPFSADGWPDSLERLHPFPNLLAAARLDRLPTPEGMIAVGTDHEPDGPGLVPPVDRQVVNTLETLAGAGFQAYVRPLSTTSAVARRHVVRAERQAGPDPAPRLGPQVWQVTVPGLERFHLVRLGLPVEPIGRLRTKALVALARQPQ